MDIKDYCEITKTELETLKTKVNDFFSKFDKTSSDHRKKFKPTYNEIETIIKEIDERIDQLQRECPEEWDLQKDELDVKLTKLKEILENALPTEVFIG